MHENGLQRQKGVVPLVGSQETKSASCPADKPRINRGSTGDFVPPSVYIGFRLFVLLERRSSDVSSIPWKEWWTFVSWANNSVGKQSCPTSTGRSAGRSDPNSSIGGRILQILLKWPHQVRQCRINNPNMPQAVWVLARRSKPGQHRSRVLEANVLMAFCKHEQRKSH